MRFRSRPSDDAFTGLEAAIVLIAFVVVAAVFSYVVLGAGFYTTQKSQETVYKSVEQSTSNIQIIGQIYGVSSDTSAGIDSVEFAIGLAPGAEPADLTKMSIVYSTDYVSPLTYSYGGDTPDAGARHFSAVLAGTSTAAPSLSANQQVTIGIPLDSSSLLGSNTKLTVDVRPIIGSSYAFTRSTGALIDPINIM